MISEARPVAIIRAADTTDFIGLLYLWEDGEVAPLWIEKDSINLRIEPLPGECPSLADWTPKEGN